MSACRYIWGQRAMKLWAQGKTDPSHTISAPNIAECYESFVAQLRAGTPWVLVDEDEQILDTGTAGFTGGVRQA